MTDVLVTGLESSGSTAVWQAVCQILNTKIKKYHSFVDKPNAIHIVTIRDMRDILASFCRREVFGKPKDINDYTVGTLSYMRDRFNEIAKYAHHQNTYFIFYESWVGYERLLVDTLAEILDVTLSEKRVKEIADYISVDRNRKRASKHSRHGEYDKETKIHGNHITTATKGDWKKHFAQLTPETRERVLADLKPHLVLFGYETD